MLHVTVCWGCANAANAVAHLRARGWRQCLASWASHYVSALWICAESVTIAKQSHYADFRLKPLAQGSGLAVSPTPCYMELERSRERLWRGRIFFLFCATGGSWSLT